MWSKFSNIKENNNQPNIYIQFEIKSSVDKDKKPTDCQWKSYCKEETESERRDRM